MGISVGTSSQLTGKAQQAYAAMPQSSAGKYADLKAAILRRYDINEETYRQRFRGVAHKENKTYRELAVRLMDLLTKVDEGVHGRCAESAGNKWQSNSY